MSRFLCYVNVMFVHLVLPTLGATTAATVRGSFGARSGVVWGSCGCRSGVVRASFGHRFRPISFSAATEPPKKPNRGGHSPPGIFVRYTGKNRKNRETIEKNGKIWKKFGLVLLFTRKQNRNDHMMAKDVNWMYRMALSFR